MITVSKEVAKAITTGMGEHYFQGDAKQFLKNHSSVVKNKDLWGPTLNALNTISYETLETALNDGYSIEKKCAICGGSDKVNGQARINGEMESVCYVCLIGVAHSTPDYDEQV